MINLLKKKYKLSSPQITRLVGYDIVNYRITDGPKKYILKVYKKFGKNKSQTARALGIALNTLKSKLETYDVENLSAKAPTAKK